MPRWLSTRALLTGLFLFFIPLLCGVAVLAGALAFAAFYFIAFLQAVMIIQDQIGTS